MAKQTQSFNAEIKQLLDLMIHSLYSHKEIYLRELISNASDALDKVKFQSLTDDKLLTAGTELQIRLEPRIALVHDQIGGMARGAARMRAGHLAEPIVEGVHITCSDGRKRSDNAGATARLHVLMSGDQEHRRRDRRHLQAGSQISAQGGLAELRDRHGVVSSKRGGDVTAADRPFVTII